METNPPKRRDNKKSLRVKVISLGNAEVGKSCIIKRYCEKRFVPKYLATIGIDYGVTKVQVRDREIKVNIFDMAGHPFFYEVRNEFYKDSQGVLLVYDVGLRESFDALDSWLGEMKQEMGSQANMDSIVFVVCANKVDLTKRRVVDEGEGRLWAESRGFHYFETSAQSGEGINEMFQVFLAHMRSFLYMFFYGPCFSECRVLHRRSSPPSLTCARTAESARCRRSASASPKSRLTPSDVSATAKTRGICWESNPGPRGRK
uniref:DnaJ (Hsp40) homolog, subfamily C, member 27 n=1 Tax=Haplochromis burtoni TaxID=8153 RepID=A0A3Q3BH42_HAPBU